MINLFKKTAFSLLFILTFGFHSFLSSSATAAVCGAPMWDYKYTGELAKISGASKIEIDYAGQIYVSDFSGNAIRIYDSKGEEVNVVPVSSPRGVAVSQAGEIYVAQTNSVSIISLDDKGKVASYRNLGDSRFAFANDVAVDLLTGRVFVVDSIYKRVFVYGSDDSYITHFAADPIGSKEWIGIDIDQENGLIYLAAQGSNRVEVYRLGDYSLAKALVRPYGRSSDSEFAMLQGISADASGRFFVVDGGLDVIQFFDGCYTYLTTLGIHGYGPGELNLPLDVAADAFGRIYVSNIDGRISIFRSAQMVAPVPLSPVGNALLLDNVFSLVVTNGSIKPYENGVFADNLSYEFQIATDEKFANIVVKSPLINEDPLGATSWDTSGLVADGTFFWRARIFDGTAYGPWSVTENFKVELPNAAPVIDPDSVVPVDNTPSVTAGNLLSFDITANDPENDILTYTWFIDGVEVAYTQAFDYMPLGEDVGSHTIVVRVSDGINQVDWTWNVSVNRVDTPPVAPSADRPVGGADVVTLAPELSVNNSYDAEGDKLNYIFEVSETNDFTVIIDTVIASSGLNATVATVGINVALKDNGLYYWRARSCEVEYVDVCSSYSAVESFFVNTANDAPQKPVIGSPSGGSHVASVTPVLDIMRSSDVDFNDTLTYDFEISSDSAYLDIVMRAEGLVATEGKDLVSFALDSQALNDNQLYYWRARAVDNHGLASGWALASFFVNTANDAPSVPALLSPAQDEEVESLAVTLVTSNSVDADMDPLVYIFQIDRDSTFNSPLLESPELNEGAGATSWAIPEQLEENTLYYWRVKVSDGKSVTTSDSVGFFVNSANEPPLLPSLKTPLLGEKVMTNKPQLSIYPSIDPDRDVVKYTYQVSDSADFGYIVAQSPPTDTLWSISIPLGENISYYWRALAIDEHDLASNWSDTGSFMVNVLNEAPSAPVISSQMFGFTDNVVLDILNSSDPEGDILTYNVEIFSDRGLTEEILSEKNIPEGDKLTQWVVNSKLMNGVYYWRVRAHDGQTYGIWSGTRELHIDKARGNSNPRTDKAYGRKRF